MSYDYSRLLGRITEKFGSQRAFAKAVGMSENSISRKLTGKETITVGNMEDWSRPELLDIAPKQYPIFYFAMKEEVEGD